MLNTALEKWQSWGLIKQPQLTKTFTNGKSHHTGLVEIDHQKWVLKVFNHSFEQAINAQQFAAELGIAPELVFHDDHVALMEYIEGGPPSATKIAQALHKLHHKTNQAQSSLNLLEACDTYLHRAPEEILIQHQKLLPILNEFVLDKTPHCFCHNDLVVENCLSQQNTAIIIDWEYAAQHNPWFDLAAVVLYQHLSLAQAKDFLQHYNNWQHKTDERIYLVSQVALLWGDLLWHIANFGKEYAETHQRRFHQLESLVQQLI